MTHDPVAAKKEEHQQALLPFRAHSDQLLFGPIPGGFDISNIENDVFRVSPNTKVVKEASRNPKHASC